TITGATSGTQVHAGQKTSVIVTVQDAGRVKSLTFRATGVAAVTETRTSDSGQTSMAASFVVQVTAGAKPGEVLFLDATAEDLAGNIGTAARVVLPVADNVPPVITSLHTDSGRLQVVPGRSVTVVVEAEDDLGVSEIQIAGQGAFVMSAAKQIVPPLTAGGLSFVIQIPATAVTGAAFTVIATALDLAGNTSAPVTLGLVVAPLPDVTFGPSIILAAGETKSLTVQLASAAPAGGTRIDFSSDPAIATPTAFVIVPAGQTGAVINVTGVAGGTAFVTALIEGVQRGSATVVVEGGVVNGTVRDPQLTPVAGAMVAVYADLKTLTTTTDANGRFQVRGLFGPAVSVKVLKDVTPSLRLLGFANPSMNRVNGFVNVDIILLADGIIHGPVYLADGVTPVSDGIKVDLFEVADLAHAISTTFTKDGVYEFPLVAVGKYVVEVSDTNGNRGRKDAEVATSGQDVLAPASFLGRGSLVVVVKDGGGSLVKAALVNVLTSSIFGNAPAISGTAVDGTFTVPNLLFGTFLVQAINPTSSQAASMSGSITVATPPVTVVLALASYGGVQGTVYRADGTTTVAGATVTAAGNISTITDTQGKYALAFLPLGTTTLFVREPASRGIGVGSVTLGVQGETRPVNINLFPQGTLIVTVQTANGASVPGATVRIGAGAGFASDNLVATTGADGTVIVDHVITGAFSVRADAGNLLGFASGTLAPNEQRPVLVHLQATASITGTVRAPNDALVTDGSVTIAAGPIGGTVPMGPDGTFRFDNLTFGSYMLLARDVHDRVRAHVFSPIVLASPDQVAHTSMKYVGLGSVGGRVLNPDGSSAIGLGVQVRSLNPEFGGFRPTVSTNAGGFYAVPDIPVGDFTISVANTLLHLRGEATGTIVEDGSAPAIDILLRNNLIDLPVTKWDANNFTFDLQKDASVLTGTNGAFTGVYAGKTWGGLQLDVTEGGTVARFVGSSFGTVEDRNREIAVHQDSLAGLSVTRKVFVPADGYFARYLEILTNPSTAPITVDVRVSSNVQGNVNGTDSEPAIIATSSGDDQLDVITPATRDRWVVVDDVQPGDPFAAGGLPSMAFVFDGANGATAVAAAAFTAPDPAIPLGPRELSYEWHALTIPAGGTVALMHFAVQETTRPAAQAAAQRLVQLSPEAVAGLSTEELAEIQNFAAPADGVSTLAGLAPLTGAISGRVLASDGTTAVAGVPVSFQSNDVLFGRTYQTMTAADGAFAFTSALTDGGSSRAIPAEAFTLRAEHPTLGAQAAAPPATGQFVAGAQSAQQDIVFSNTGLSRGTVRFNGVPVSGATVTARAQINGAAVSFTTQSVASGDYAFTLLPAGTFTFTATSVQQGVTRQAETVGAVAAGQTAVVDIGIDTIAPQVTITVPAAGAQMDPRVPLAVTVTASDAAGVAQIGISAAGATSAAEVREITPAAQSRTEMFTVPFTTFPATGGTVVLNATARDNAGNQASAVVTVTVRDVVAPGIILVTPASEAGAVEADAAIVVRFSEPIARATVTATSIRLTLAGAAVTAAIGYADGDRIVTLTPAGPLKLNTTFTIEVTTSLTDPAGNALPAPFSSVFKTKSPDVVPPRVASIAPANNAVNVPVGTDIRVSFTEPIEPATITPTSFRVVVNGAAIAGHVNMLDAGATLRFSPDAPLPFDAVVAVELTSAVTDLFENALVDAAGHALTAPLTFTFLTGTFGITSPAQGSAVLESTPLTLEAKAGASLNIATITFSVNGAALPAVAGPLFSTVYDVGTAAAAPALTIVATGRTAAGAVVAQDRVAVTVLAGIQAHPRLLGVPLGGTSLLRVGLPAPLATDLPIQVSVVDSTIATVPSAPLVLSAGQLEVAVPVTGVATGATTVIATSSRGTTWSVASVSAVVPKAMSVDGSPVGLVVVPARLLGHVYAPVSGQSVVRVPVLGAPAVVVTPVDISSSNTDVASIATAVTIAPGSQSANITITSGVAGTATLTVRAGSEVAQLTVVVGDPAPGTIPPVLAQPVGVVIIPSASAGHVFTAPSSQSTFKVTLLSAPAATATSVTVTSSDSSVATVAGSVVIPAGQRTAEITLTNGAEGSATLTFHAGSETWQVSVVVGTPAPGTAPPTLASPVGVVLLGAPSAGRLITPPATSGTFMLQLVSVAVTTATPVTVTSSNPAIAAVSDSIVIAPGSKAGPVTIVTGTEGIATLTFRAGTETRQLTIVVGTPAPGTEPLVLADPVGVVVIEQRRLGSVISAAGGQPTLNVTVLSAPAASPTIVTVSSSAPNVASVSGPVVIAAGDRGAAITILTGIEGVATLTLRAGSDVAQVVVVVGVPPISLRPLVTAPVVGVEIK
ncbi:MAG: large repetitive protein, partial [Acidobacteriota bacterium]